MLDQNLIVGLIVLAVVVFAVYSYAPKIRGMLSGVEGYANGAPAPKKQNGIKTPAANHSMGGMNNSQQAKDKMGQHAAVVTAPVPGPKKEGFSDYAPFGGDNMGPVPMKGAAKPQGCYPREQLNPMELLPQDVNSQWAAVNPTGTGDIQGKNFLSAGALIGINTVGQSLRNSNLQIRAEPPNPQIAVSPWLQSTIEPDLSRRPLE
jgi:hypothetical protein